MSEDSTKSEPQGCLECGARWIRSGHRFTVEGELSDMSVPDAAEIYYANEDEYDATIVVQFECGNVVPTTALEGA